jgi:hypothetical protein
VLGCLPLARSCRLGRCSKSAAIWGTAEIVRRRGHGHVTALLPIIAFLDSKLGARTGGFAKTPTFVLGCRIVPHLGRHQSRETLPNSIAMARATKRFSAPLAKRGFTQLTGARRLSHRAKKRAMQRARRRQSELPEGIWRHITPEQEVFRTHSDSGRATSRG